MLKPILLSLLSATLYVLSFAPWDLGALQWIAFVPLFYAASLYPRVFRLSFITQFFICLGGFYWIAYSVQRYGELPLPVSILVLLIFCCFGQLQIPIYMWVRARLLKSSYFAKKIQLWPLFGAALYVGIESIFPKLFSDTAGNAFYKLVWARQAVEIAGPFLLTFCSIFVNEQITHALIKKDLKLARSNILAATICILFLNLYGAVRSSQVQSAMDTAMNGPKLNISLIQANIGDYLKLASEQGNINASREVMDQYLGLSANASQSAFSPDLIVWPETAYPSTFGKPNSQTDFAMESRVKQFATAYHGTLAFGGYDTDIERRDYNSLFFLRAFPDQPFLETYHKAILLQFGETIPGIDYFPNLKQNFPTMGFFGRGPGAQIFTLPKKHPDGSTVNFYVAPSICYEALFPNHSYSGNTLGADFLLNVTNDSWFGKYGEPYLHLALTTYRSIENRQYMVRSTNTGISAVIDPLGEIVQNTSLFTQEILNTSIPKRLEISRIPSGLSVLFLYLCEVIAFLSVAYVVINRKALKN